MRVLIAQMLRVLAYRLTEPEIRNFKSIFQGYIAPKYLSEVKWSMVGAVANQVVNALSSEDRAISHSDVIDHFIDFLLGTGKDSPVEHWHQFATDMKIGLVRKLMKEFPEFKEMGLDEASEAVKNGKIPLLENRRKYLELAGKLVGGRLYKYLNNAAKQYIRQKSKEESVELKREKGEQVPFEEKEDYETYTPSEKGPAEISGLEDDEIQALKKLRRDKSLIRKIRHYVDSLQDDQKKRIYQTLLSERFLTNNPKTQNQVAKDLGISQPTVVREEEKFIKNLRDHFLGTKEIKEDVEEEIREDIKIPPYTKILNDKSNSESFKKFYRIGIRSRGRSPSEATSNIMNALAEGKSVNEVVQEVPDITKNQVYNTLKREFNKQYQKWYRAHHSKQASIASFIRRIVEGINPCMK